MIMLGGPKARGHKIYGDIVLCFQYVNDEEAMVLFPRTKKSKVGAFVVCLSSAFKYAESVTGQPTPYLFEQAAAAAKIMGFEASKSMLFKIADIIVSNLPDLLKMKPEQVEEGKSYGSGILTSADGRASEFDLKH